MARIQKHVGVELRFERPLVTVDVIIFTVLDEQLHVLLVQRPETRGEPFPGRWALPGGFIDVGQDRDLLQCARRKLKAKTGVSSPYLEQLGSWGSADRDPRGWSATHAYFALAPIGHLELRVESQEDGTFLPTMWAPVDEALGMSLAFDHGEILQAAVERLRGKVEYTSLPAFLLPEPMTLPQLQHVYEVVLGRALDKSAFRRRMLDAGFLEEAGTVSMGGRVAQGFRLRDRREPTVFPRSFKAAE
ncbi:MAG TPA: NUDIX domain-containing protein [Ramlibacter sp.]|uniref:NUDIX hydrolase n=1 Tax=Ramlibacter sp. TaxID=1917967 RepID=UPI002D4BF21D|nr:NUDIX domain-containing protein [Ramlibacter sp.]HZY20740.1 NUDIX domain-containing protein [Ramlibacter sp.]